ncbi:MAG: TetR/AcrR family transcriptional regulator [Pseudomonadota bacterium]
MPDRNYRNKLKANTLIVAKRIVENEGLGALQARRIAQEAGCSVGTIYNLYDGLDDLIVRVNAGTLEDLGAKLSALETGNSENLADSLTAMALAYLSFALDKQTSWRAVFEHQLAKDKVVPDWYREHQAALFSIVEKQLASVVSDDRERRLAARALFAAVHGIVSIALDQKLGDFDYAATQAQVKFIVQSAAHGLVARPSPTYAGVATLPAEAARPPLESN